MSIVHSMPIAKWLHRYPINHEELTNCKPINL